MTKPLTTLSLKCLLITTLLASLAGLANAAHTSPALAPPSTPPSAPNSETLAALLEPIREAHKLPGLAAAIISSGEVTEIAAVGVRRAGDEEPLTTGDKFHIGSCTKAMTATMIATLVEEGTLSWTTTVGKVFADIPMRDEWKPITLEQLLQNRAGAPADLNKDGLWQRLWAFRGAPREARLELVRGVLAHPPITPGNFLYSNASFAIAGAMAEKVTDSSWEDLMRDRLFAPLGMTSPGFGAPGSTSNLDQPRGHRANGRPQEPGPLADNPPAIGPASTVHCTLADWARFIALHTAPDPEPALINRETRTRLHTPADGPGERYAMGWLVTKRPWAAGEDGQGLALTHAGSNTLWYAVTWLAPERDFAILITTNQGGPAATRACDEAVGVLIKHHLAREQTPRGNAPDPD